jgi:hypothetical protein
MPFEFTPPAPRRSRINPATQIPLLGHGVRVAATRSPPPASYKRALSRRALRRSEGYAP